MKYLAKVLVEYDYEVDAADTDTAVKKMNHLLRGNAVTDGSIREINTNRSASKLHGVVREDIGWPDTSTEAQRPPPKGGPPPSGTPGVGTGSAPMVDQQEEFVFERAAA